MKAVIAACTVTMAGGFGLGWAFFANHADESAGNRPGGTVATTSTASSPAAELTSAAPVPATAPAPAEVPAAAAPPPPSRWIAVTVAGWSLAPGPTVTSPMRGEVRRAFLKKARRIGKGDKLFELKRRRAPTARSKELAARIAEFEKLSESDPVYREFLARARREYRKSKKTVRVTVTAASSGWMQPEVVRRQRVDEGDPLATLVDPRVRIGRVMLSGAAVRLDWSCAASDARLRDDVSCRIADVAETEGGQAVSLRVEADRSRWSRGLEREEFVLALPEGMAGR